MASSHSIQMENRIPTDHVTSNALRQRIRNTTCLICIILPPTKQQIILRQCCWTPRGAKPATRFCRSKAYFVLQFKVFQRQRYRPLGLINFFRN